MYRLDEPHAQYDREALERGEVGLCAWCGTMEHWHFLQRVNDEDICGSCLTWVDEQKRLEAKYGRPRTAAAS